jgi:hypothetical protein
MSDNEVWSHLERMGHADDGTVGALASTALGAKRIATAVQNAAGNLEVIAWAIRYNGTIKRLGSKEGGPTTRVAIGALSDKRFVTAARTEAGGLKLTVWDVDEDGQITRLESGETGEIHGEFAIATMGTYRVVTAVRDSEDRLKLISWHIYPAGTVQRLKDALAGEVSEIAMATYDPYPLSNGSLATAVKTKSGNLKVIAWDIDTGGGLHRKGDVEGGPVKDIVAATLSHRRIVTATRNLQDNLEVQTWDFDAQGNVSLHASAKAGEISALAIATLNAARVITAVRDAAHNLKLIVWDAIDNIVRLGAANAGGIKLLSVVPLGSDWVVSPVAIPAGTLRLIAWREHAVSLLHSQWGPTPITLHANKLVKAKLAEVSEDFVKMPIGERQEVGLNPPLIPIPSPDEPTADRAPTSSPLPTLVFEPGVEGVDPMIAVGFNYIIVTQDHRIAFFDKEGKPLPKKDTEVNLSTTEFFSTFLKGKLPDGSRNEHSIQRHTGFPPGGALTAYPPGTNCDPDASWPAISPCINEFFDTRVHFDPASRRFFILAAARPYKCVNNLGEHLDCDKGGTKVSTIANPLARRYWAFAVSRSEDPRDGFYQWMTTEAHWFDFPFLTVNQGVMVMATNVAVKPLTVQPIGMKPVVFVFSVEDLLKGKKYPRSHKFFPPEFSLSPGAEAYPDVFPLTHYGDTANRTFFVQPAAETINVFSFKNPSDWRNFSGIEKTSATVMTPGGKTVPVGGPWNGATFQDGKIFFTWTKTHVEAKDEKSGHYSIRLVRLPLNNLHTNPTASNKTADGFLYRNFGTNAPDDDPSDVVSYEKPAPTMNNDGHMVILYCRVGFNTKNPLYPEVRYSVYYADDRGLCSSQSLQKGNASAPVSPINQLDYQTAVVDPADSRTVWMISEYSKNGSYKTVVGKVTP